MMVAQGRTKRAHQKGVVALYSEVEVRDRQEAHSRGSNLCDQKGGYQNQTNFINKAK